MNTDKVTLFVYCNFLVLLSTTVCSQNINKQNVNIADEILTDYSFLSRYHYTKSKNYLKRRYRIRHWIPMFFGTPCNRIDSLKYPRFTTFGCKDAWIRKSQKKLSSCFQTVLFPNCSVSKLFCFQTALFPNCSVSKLSCFQTVLFLISKLETMQ